MLHRKKVNLHYRHKEERDQVRDGSFIAALWRLWGTPIRDKRRNKDGQIALMNAMYVGSGERLETVLHVRQVTATD